MSDLNEDVAHVDGKTFQFNWFVDDKISGIHFTGCDFIQVKFGACIDVVFEMCRFEGCEFLGDMYTSTFVNSTIDGLRFADIALDDSQFIDCRMRRVQFVRSSLIGSALVRTDLHEAQFLDADATMVNFEDCNLWGAKFDDSALYAADLSTSHGFDTSDLEPALGDAKTVLPEGMPRPEHWFQEEGGHFADGGVEGVPGQVAAPLRVVWRDNRLIPDARGYGEETLKKAAVLSIFRALRADLAVLCDQSPSNYPIVRHIDALNRLLQKGVAAVNPVEVGYQIEMLKAFIAGAEEYLSEPTIAQIRAVIIGGTMFVMQFADWRSIVDNVADERSNIQSSQLANAVSQLATAIRGAGDTIDKRIALSLETQSADLNDAKGAQIVAEGVAGSASNVVSALVTRLWSIVRTAGAKVGDETLKYTVKAFLDANKSHLISIANSAPKHFNWIRDALEQLLK